MSREAAQDSEPLVIVSSSFTTAAPLFVDVVADTRPNPIDALAVYSEGEACTLPSELDPPGEGSLVPRTSEIVIARSSHEVSPIIEALREELLRQREQLAGVELRMREHAQRVERATRRQAWVLLASTTALVLLASAAFVALGLLR